jgi:predicted  nucleic acid-binding Zn-ribbon protein
LDKTMIDLIELQEIDSRLQELEEKRGDLPEVVKRKKQELASEETTLTRYDDELKDVLSQMRKVSGDLEDAQEKLKKYEQQLFEVRNNREYDAMTSEIENKKLEIDRLESEKSDLLSRQEVLEKNIEELQQTVDNLSNEFTDKRKELDEKLKTTEKEETSLKKSRANVVKNVQKALMIKYERIRNAKSGLAVVPVLRDACGGCSTILPPQRLNDIRSQDGLYLCESCGRMLYWKDEA